VAFSADTLSSWRLCVLWLTAAAYFDGMHSHTVLQDTGTVRLKSVEGGE
jgi:hypothetical protein